MFNQFILVMCGYKDPNKYQDLLSVLKTEAQINTIYTLNEVLEEQTKLTLERIFKRFKERCQKVLPERLFNDPEANDIWGRYDRKELDKMFVSGRWPSYSIVLTRTYKNKEGKDIHLAARLVLNRDHDYLFVELVTEGTNWKWINNGESLSDIFNNEKTELIDKNELDLKNSYKWHVIVKSKAIPDANNNIPSFARLNPVGLALSNDVNPYADICADKLISLVNNTLEFLEES